MGREVKRVPLDFNLAIGDIWPGFLLPKHLNSIKCIQCGGDGYNPKTSELSKAWYSFDQVEWVSIFPGNRRYNNLAWQYHLEQTEVETLVKGGRLMDFTHTWNKVAKEGWKPKDPPYMPTAEEVNEWAHNGMGHDSVNQWLCVESRARRLGFWGRCLYCKGEGVVYRSIIHKWRNEHWNPKESPKGKGFQMWENVTEGSPISPVFDSPEKLAKWLVKHDASASGSMTANYEQWLRVCKGGYAPTMISSSTGIQSGVAGL